MSAPLAAERSRRNRRLGALSSFSYDPMDRPASASYADGSSEQRTYSGTGLVETVTDSRGLTAYSCDLRDRLIGLAQPDGPTLGYGYDLVGNRTSVQTLHGGQVD